VHFPSEQIPTSLGSSASKVACKRLLYLSMAAGNSKDCVSNAWVCASSPEDGFQSVVLIATPVYVLELPH
jgi:hypothetical protein